MAVVFGGLVFVIVGIVAWLVLVPQRRARSHVLELVEKARGSKDPASVFGLADPESIEAAKAIAASESLELPATVDEAGNYAQNPAIQAVCFAGELRAKGKTTALHLLTTTESLDGSNPAIVKMSLTRRCSCHPKRPGVLYCDL